MRFLPAIVANVILVVAALGFGSLLSRLFPKSFSTIDRLAFIFLGGLGLLGTFLFDAGQAWFSQAVFIPTFLVGVLLGIKFLRSFGRDRGLKIARSSVALLPAIVVAIVLLVTAVGGLAEPTGDIHMDAIAYHLLGPKVWLREGVIRPVLDESHTSFPATVESMYGALIAFGGQRAPELFAVISLLSLLFITASLALRMGLDSSGVWWAIALIFTMPVVYRGAYGGFVDVVLAGFVLAAARIGFDAERAGDYALFGLFCGFAMGTKYTGLVAWVLLSVCAILIAVFVRRCDEKAVLKNLGVACAVALAIAAPCYVRNWVLMGCPIYPPPPHLPRYFHVKYLSTEAIEHFNEQIQRVGTAMGRGPLSFLLLPYNLTYHTANFLNGAGGIGLAPLAFGPFGLIVRRRDWFAKGLAFFAFLAMAAWFVTDQEARFVTHVYVIAAIFAVWGWRYITREAPKYGPLLSAVVVACSILYGLYMIATTRADDAHAVVSSSFEEIRRQAEDPYLETFRYLNRESSVTKVLILDPGVPPYYMEKNYLKPWGRFGEQTLPEATNPQELLSALPQLHISHVLDVRDKEGSFRLPDHPNGLTPVFQREGQRIYRVD